MFDAGKALSLFIGIFAMSVLETTSGADESHPKGSVVEGSYDQSRVYPGASRRYWVYVPAQLDVSKKACVFICQDGLNPKFAAAMDSLIAKGEMPPAVGIFISPGSFSPPAGSHDVDGRSNRCYEYDSLGDSYARFLLEEMIPFVASKHSLNLSDDPNDRCIAGASSGGICAFNAAWERPDAFRRVYCNSGSFVAFRGGNILASLIRKYEAKPIRIFMHVATHDMENAGGNWWFANQEFERSLAFAGYDYCYRWSEGGHVDRYVDEFPDAMRWLWRDYPAPVAAGKGPPRVQDLLIPDERWILAGDGFKDLRSLAANAKGELFACDASDGTLFRAGLDGKFARFGNGASGLCGLSAGPDGRIYGISAALRRVVVFDDDGSSRTLADGVPGSSILASRGGGFYLCGQEGGSGKVWRLDAKGAVKELDFGLRDPRGISASVDGWLLHVSDAASHWVYSYKIDSDGALSNKERFFWLHVPDDADDSGASAVCVDGARLLAATRMGVQTCDMSGHNQCVIPLPPGEGGPVALCFGGEGFNILYASNGRKIFCRKLKERGYSSFDAPRKPGKQPL